MNELIVIKQLPIIEEKLEKLSLEIEEEVKSALELTCTEETVKQVKDVRAKLNKDKKELEEQRKYIKNEIMKPYDAIEKVYNDKIKIKYDKADSELKDKIDSVEDSLKLEKETEVRNYFNELLVAEHIDFVKYEQANINITLSVSKKLLKQAVKEFIDKIVEDLKLIDTQNYKDEILVEYMKNLNVSKSITEVVDRHFILDLVSKKEEEKAQVVVQEQKVIEKVEQNLTAPTEEIREEIFEVSFKVRGTKEKLREIKEFLENGGYEYE